MKNEIKNVRISIICLLVIIISGIVIKYAIEVISYKEGWGLTGNNLYIKQIGLSFFYIFICLIALIITLIKIIHNLKKKEASCFWNFLFFLVSIAIAIYFRSTMEPVCIHYEKGFCDRIVEEIEIDAIQSFLLSKSDISEDTVIPFEEWPAEIKKLTPNSYVKVEKDQDDSIYIKLAWGSPFCHFGIQIGTGNLETHTEEYRSYEIDKGIYFWSEK